MHPGFIRFIVHMLNRLSLLAHKVQDAANLLHTQTNVCDTNTCRRQMMSPERKSHQELMPSMQYTHCRRITNQIIKALFKKHKYWATLITYYLITPPVLVYAKQIPFGSNEARISLPRTC